MTEAFICDAIRTPFGRYAGALSAVRADDLGAIPLRALMQRNPGVDWAQLSDVLYGCANQAGEDNRNVARMAALLAGLPVEVPGATINRLCGSGLDAVGTAARAIKGGEAGLVIAGGVESMSRAPFVMPKMDAAFGRSNAVYDTTIGWRFVNPLMKAQYGVDSMPETAENVAEEHGISREAQDRMALASQQHALAAQQAGHLAREIVAVTLVTRKGDAVVVTDDEHPRATSLEALARLKPIVRPGGTVTAGNASGVNDGAGGGYGRGGCGAARHGHRPGAGHAEVAGADGRVACPDRRDRTQRGFCRAGPGGAAPAGPRGRRRARQCLGRRDCARPPTGRQRRAPGHHGRQSPARHRWPLCAVHHVHWRGAGDCVAARARLAQAICARRREGRCTLSCCRILGMGDFKKFGASLDAKVAQLFAAAHQYQG